MVATTIVIVQPEIQRDPLQEDTELSVAAPGTTTIGISGRLTGATSIPPVRTSTSGSAAFSRSRKRAGTKQVYMAAGFYFLNSNFWGFKGASPLVKKFY